MALILASGSPRRKELLKNLGYSFKVITSNQEEKVSNELSVYDNVMNISYKKAYGVYLLNQEDFIIGADTVVSLDSKIYGKPKSIEDAIQTLKLFSGKTHEVITGVSLISKNIRISFYVKSLVTFKKLSLDEIINYVNTKEPMDKAGSYAIQGIGKNLIEKYEGSLNNIIGLPIEELNHYLKEYYKGE